MATTFTNDRGIKNIGTGLESGTWGASTNQNFERISDSLGRCVSLDITAMPLGSTSTTAAGAPGIEVEWVLLGASDSGGDSSEAGSEPRCAAVEFKDTFDALAGSTTPIINIRGGTSSVYANRMFVVFNNLGNSNSLKLAGGSSGDFTLLNGKAALVCSKVSTTGVWSLGVNGLLDDIQLNNIVLAASTGEIEFVGTGTVTIKDQSSTAFVISDGTDDLVKIDTSTGAKVITLDGDGDVTVDMSGGGTQSTTIAVHATDAEALKIWDNADDCIVVDNSADEIKFGDAGTGKDIRVFGDVILSDQASDIVLKDVTAAALEIADESANKYLNVLTHGTVGTRRVNSVVTFTSPDIVVTGTDGYINMDATVGTTGYGFRNNSGSMEVKDSTGAWTKLLRGGIATAIGNSTDPGTAAVGEQQSGSFDIGPIRIWFDTVEVPSVSTSTITLTAFNSEVYTVMAQYAEEFSSDSSAGCWVVDRSLQKIALHNQENGAKSMTYWAIGDSGA